MFTESGLTGSRSHHVGEGSDSDGSGERNKWKDVIERQCNHCMMRRNGLPVAGTVRSAVICEPAVVALRPNPRTCSIARLGRGLIRVLHLAPSIASHVRPFIAPTRAFQTQTRRFQAQRVICHYIWVAVDGNLKDNT
jgi:hypothetical protein